MSKSRVSRKVVAVLKRKGKNLDSTITPEALFADQTRAAKLKKGLSKRRKRRTGNDPSVAGAKNERVRTLH
jgi:hypothetical protein